MSTPEKSGHGLKKKLHLSDLVLMQILLVVGIPWAGIAARQGGVHVVFWLAGALLFFLPSAAVVSFCAKLWPEEGGVYQWVKHACGPFAGFVSAWNLYLWALLTASNVGIVTASGLSYALGPDFAWMADSKIWMVGLTVGAFAVIWIVNVRGLGVTRWVSHLGTSVTIGVTVLLTILLFVHPHTSAAHPHVSPQKPFSFAFPLITLVTLNLFAKMSFHSLGGLEQVAVFAGEMKSPGKIILRSAWIAAPLCALIYILLTGSLLTYIPAGNIDLIAPIPQVLSAAFGNAATDHSINIGLLAGRATVLLLTIALVCQYVVIVAEASRLSMVAGWDNIMPARFTQLHPRWKTPVWSISMMVALAVLLGLCTIAGSGNQEAFQVLTEASSLCFGIYYLLMLVVPLFMGRRFSMRPALWLRVAVISAASVTVMAIVFTLVPIVPVPSKWVFAGKIVAITLLLNAIAAGIYFRSRRNHLS